MTTISAKGHRLLMAGILVLGASLAGAGLSVSQETPAAAPTESADAATEFPSPTNPLTPEQITADRAAWIDSDCASCHGWSGNGRDTGPVAPGPSLRSSELDFETTQLIIQCGLPATRMPSHDRLAYVDTRCYDSKSADMGDTKPPKGQSMKPAEIEAVAAYVTGFLQGRGEITKAECVDYYGGEVAACANYE